MSYVKPLLVPYHQQDTAYYCGAACAQMVIASLNLGLLDQTTLYNSNHNNTSWDQNLYDAQGHHIIWATPPDGLKYTLNQHRPSTWHGRFVSYLEYPLDWQAANSEDAASRKIAWTIEHYEISPCALVLAAAHWIVVNGMDLSKQPASYDDVSYTINSFRVDDPWPPVPSSSYWTNPSAPPPPPHSNSDGCGSASSQGTADSWVTYSYWQQHYMTAANVHPQSHWQGLYVAICDPEPPPTRRGPIAGRLRRFDGTRLITSEQVVGVANDVLKKWPFPLDERWSAQLKAVRTAGPIIVKRLDRMDDYYHIVPLASGKKGATSALLFDARFGELQQASLFPRAQLNLINPPSEEQIHRLVVGKQFELPHHAGSLIAHKDWVRVLDHWFWRPCEESLSPLWPFRLVQVGNALLYCRIDGALFTSLTTNTFGI